MSNTITKYSSKFKHCGLYWSLGYLVKVGSDDGVQDPLAMCPVHHYKCQYLQNTSVLLQCKYEQSMQA